MVSRLGVFALALLLLPAGSGAAGEETATPGIVRVTDVPYAQREGADPALTSLDLYAPGTEGPHPVLVMVHGGGWRAGDKAGRGMTESKVPWFVGRGFVYVSVNYRLSGDPKVKHPDHVEDVAAALAWVHDHAAEHGGDPERIFLMGHSAGAHLAALVATDHRRLEAVGKSLRILRGVVCLDTAAYDVPRFVNELGAGLRMRALYEQAFGPTEEAWRDASPRHHVAPGKAIPPMLFFHTGSRMAGEQLSQELVAALRKAGTPAVAIHAADRDHAGINACIGVPDDPYTELVMRFLAAPEEASGLSPEPAGDPEGRAAPGVVFHRDYAAGTRDRQGRWMGGTETMRLVAHEGRLYAAIGYWTDVPGDDPRPGGQVLVRKGPNDPWQVDRDFPGSLRVNALESVTFATDRAGRALEEPVTLLLADAGLVAAREGGPLVVWVRDGEGWHESPIAERAPRAFVRAFGTHRDRVTGADLVFAGTGAGEIYAGAYDPSVPGRIAWSGKPEYRNPDFDGGSFQRVSAFCECGGDVYASAAPRLLRRTDGPEPGWTEVYRWNADLTRNGAGLRGITAVPDPADGHEVILGAWERAGTILRIDPEADFAATVELDSRAFLRQRLGSFRGGGLTAYNRFVPGPHPRTGEPVHWVTVVGFRLEDPDASWLLLRHRNGTYEPIRVHDAGDTGSGPLVSTRTVEFAPWDARVLYVGGYDGAANERRNHNTAWIHRGVLSGGAPREVPPPEEPAMFRLLYTHERSLAQASAVLDAFGNGRPDLLVAAKGQVHLIRNDGGSAFSHGATFDVDNANGWGAHDFDGDGRLDAFVAQPEMRQGDAWLNLGDGTFDARDLGNETIGNTRNVLFADFDGDGLVDSYHSVSSFGTNHAGCELHPGRPDRTFGPDLIEEVLHPPVPGFWYAPVDHPERGTEKWSNKMFKGAVVRDFDGDGKPDLVTGAYADLGFQEGGRGGLGRRWVEQQERGLFVILNRSEPGKIRFEEVSRKAVGEWAHGPTAKDWNVYAVVPIDHDRDGDFDLFVAAVLRGGTPRRPAEDTRSVAFLENVSRPGEIRFVDRTAEIGFGRFNDLPAADRAMLSFASGAPIDFDNDGWTDLCLVNRRDFDKTPWPWPHLFRNEGGKRFVLVPPERHGIGGGGGGRDLNVADLDGDGRMDVVIHDGTAGGYDGADNTRIYGNRLETGNRWVRLNVVSGPAGSPAIGARVLVLEPGTGRILGLDEVRTDFCYRSKRSPVLHFGLGDRETVDVRVVPRVGGEKVFRGVKAGAVRTLGL